MHDEEHGNSNTQRLSLQIEDSNSSDTSNVRRNSSLLCRVLVGSVEQNNSEVVDLPYGATFAGMVSALGILIPAWSAARDAVAENFPSYYDDEYKSRFTLPAITSGILVSIHVVRYFSGLINSIYSSCTNNFSSGFKFFLFSHLKTLYHVLTGVLPLLCWALANLDELPDVDEDTAKSAFNITYGVTLFLSVASLLVKFRQSPFCAAVSHIDAESITDRTNNVDGALRLMRLIGFSSLYDFPSCTRVSVHKYGCKLLGVMLGLLVSGAVGALLLGPVVDILQQYLVEDQVVNYRSSVVFCLIMLFHSSSLNLSALFALCRDRSSRTIGEGSRRDSCSRQMSCMRFFLTAGNVCGEIRDISLPFVLFAVMQALPDFFPEQLMTLGEDSSFFWGTWTAMLLVMSLGRILDVGGSVVMRERRVSGANPLISGPGAEGRDFANPSYGSTGNY